MPGGLQQPCLFPPVCGLSCKGGPCARSGHEATSQWGKSIEGRKYHQEAYWPQPSVHEVHAAVGRALDELQFYMTTELTRLKELLDNRPLNVPPGDTAVPEPGHCTIRVTPGAPKPRPAEPPRGWSGVAEPVSPSVGVGKMETCWTSERSRLQAEHVDASRKETHEGRSRAEIEAERYGRLTSLGRMARSQYFDLFWIVAVLVNSLFIGVQTQWAAKHLGQEEPLGFKVITYIFSVIFTVELGLRIRAFGCKELFTGPHKWWAFLDLFMVLGSLLEAVAEALLPALSGTTGASGNLRTVRIIRVARVLRGLRVERLIHMVSSLRTLVFSIAATLKSLMWAMLLLVIIMYIVGITLTECVVDWLTHENQSGELAFLLHEYWRSLDVSMFTLFQSISGGLSWHEAVQPLEDVSLALSWIFTAYIGFTYFAVLNVVTGVFCNSAIESAQHTPEVVGQTLLASKRVYMDNLQKLFQQVDEDSNAVITFNEFEKIISNPENHAFLAALEIEAADAWTLFKLIDEDKDGVIQKDEFIAGCLQLKGFARNVEMANLNFEVSRLERKLRRYMGKLGEIRHLLKELLGHELPKGGSKLAFTTEASADSG